MKKAEKKAAREAEKQQTTEKTEKKTTRPENREARKRKSRLTPSGEHVPETTSGTSFHRPKRTEGRAGRPHPHRHRKTF